jgi:hypothetical protein
VGKRAKAWAVVTCADDAVNVGEQVEFGVELVEAVSELSGGGLVVESGQLGESLFLAVVTLISKFWACGCCSCSCCSCSFGCCSFSRSDFSSSFPGSI